jgi:hypothetical protein
MKKTSFAVFNKSDIPQVIKVKPENNIPIDIRHIINGYRLPSRTLPDEDELSIENAINGLAVNELRYMTGASIIDCKIALVESNWNKDDAINYLKNKTLAESIYTLKEFKDGY